MPAGDFAAHPPCAVGLCVLYLLLEPTQEPLPSASEVNEFSKFRLVTISASYSSAAYSPVCLPAPGSAYCPVSCNSALHGKSHAYKTHPAAVLCVPSAVGEVLWVETGTKRQQSGASGRCHVVCSCEWSAVRVRRVERVARTAQDNSVQCTVQGARHLSRCNLCNRW